MEKQILYEAIRSWSYMKFPFLTSIGQNAIADDGMKNRLIKDVNNNINVSQHLTIICVSTTTILVITPMTPANQSLTENKN